MTLQIQLLTFDDCPNRDATLQRLRSAMDQEHITADVTEVEITSPELARELRFLGSPSVRINGVDVEPAARTAAQFGLMCRRYTTPLGADGAPAIEMIRAAIRAQSAP